MTRYNLLNWITGIALAREHGVDFLLAVGGGPVIDSAKAIAYGLAEPEYDVWELFAHTRQAKFCLALFPPVRFLA